MMLGTDAGAQYGAASKLRRPNGRHDQSLLLAMSAPIDTVRIPSWPLWLLAGRALEFETRKPGSRGAIRRSL